MAVKNIQIIRGEGRDKPLFICEFGEQDAPGAGGHFIADETELKRVADEMVKSLIKPKEGRTDSG